MNLKEIEPMLKKLIERQCFNDRQTGTCGIDEAEGLGYCPPNGAERWYSKDAQVETTAICALMNALQERAEEIQKNEVARVQKEQVHQWGKLKCDLYMVNDDGVEEGSIISQDRANELISKFLSEGTKVRWNIFDGYWEEPETGCQIDESYVEEVEDPLTE